MLEERVIQRALRDVPTRWQNNATPYDNGVDGRGDARCLLLQVDYPQYTYISTNSV